MGWAARTSYDRRSGQSYPSHSQLARWSNTPNTGFQTRDGQCYQVGADGVVRKQGTKAQGKRMRAILDAEAAKGAESQP